MNIFKCFCLALWGCSLSLSGADGQNARLVNPFIGTGKCDVPTLWGNYGGTFPGAVAPWGMIQLTPETSIRPSEVGYYYEDTVIRSFSPGNISRQLHIASVHSQEVVIPRIRNGIAPVFLR